MASMNDVIRFEFNRALRKRSFWFTTLSIPLLVLMIIAISVISSNNAAKTSTQQSQAINKTAKIAVLDNSGLINEKGLAALHITTEPSLQAGIDAVKADKLDAFIYYPKTLLKSGIQIYSQDKGISFSTPYDTDATALLKQDVLAQVSTATHSSQVVAVLQNTPSVTSTTYKNGKQTNSVASLIAPGVFMMGFLALIILMSYLMLTSITEEKENRVAEILLTTIKSRSLILGKIISIFALGGVQVLIIVVPILITYLVFKSRITLPLGISLAHLPLNAGAITFGALFLVGGLIFYTGLLVGLSALFPSAQESGRYLGLAMIWNYVPIYTIRFVVTSPHALIVNVFTYFPLTAPTTSLLRNTVGTISTSQAIIAVMVIYASGILAIAFAVRAFRYGAMEYGRRISIKELLPK